ncbi:MAG TPA: polyprenol monophosphomannose synthase [Kofleriaceae bacterium]|nr:polyprenol monophosphomannose synthase [Kofleriaceae bacterium]
MPSPDATRRALIVVPTYNERDNVERVAAEFLAPVAGAELLFVDDASPDGTGELLDRIVAGDPRVHVLHRAGKLGLGTAYLDGFRWALARDYRLVIEMDADFSHHPRFLPRMVELAEAGADLVVGSRYVEGGGTINWGVRRQLISRAGGQYARLVLGFDIGDPTSGFLCYRRETLERIDLASVRSNGYGFQIEMKYRVHRAGMRIEEFPIVFEDRRVGQSKMSGGIVAEALWMVWKLRLGKS